jgi:hypothetical protein
MDEKTHDNIIIICGAICCICCFAILTSFPVLFSHFQTDSYSQQTNCLITEKYIDCSGSTYILVNDTIPYMVQRNDFYNCSINTVCEFKHRKLNT